MNTDWHELIQRHMAGITTAEDAALLQDSLKREDAVAGLYLRYMNLDVALEAHAISAAEVTRTLLAKPATRQRWFQWRPLAAAAGLVFGLFSASVVVALALPLAGKAMTLLRESFETASPPLIRGVPIEPGQWSGDSSEIVGEQQGVRPASGGQMLRFLRADFEGKQSPDSSHLADMHQLIDLRPYRQEIANGSAVVEVSASFNAIPFSVDEKYGCAVSIFALDEEMATNGSTRIGSTLMTDALAMTRSDRGRVIDRDPTTWQRVTSDLRLPPDTDFVMIRLHINCGRRSPGVTFAGHYADDVQVSLIRRAPLP